MRYRVKRVSEISGVSVRTLHHYDQIGLLTPAKMNEAGYRLYDEDDLARLQEILFFRELDFSLAEIKGILESPGYRRDAALAEQKKLLRTRVKRLKRLIKTIERSLSHKESGIAMDEHDMFAGLDDETLKEYEREAKERWGGTDAYKESERRTAKYTKEDWERIKAETGDVYVKIADLMEAGRAPEDADVQVQVQQWRDNITKHFYDCTPEICGGLGEMYVADHRFKNNIDQIRPGLAEFFSRAIAVYVGSTAQ